MVLERADSYKSGFARQTGSRVNLTMFEDLLLKHGRFYEPT